MSKPSQETGLIGEPTIVVGVVHPYVTGGANVKEEWTLYFALETWRDEDGILHSDKLHIRRIISPDELSWFRSQIQPYEVLTARVIFTASAEAELLALLDQVRDADNALVQRAAELRNRSTVEHELFGAIVPQPIFDCYTATPIWSDTKIFLDLYATRDSDLEAALQAAITLWTDQPYWNQRIQDFAVQDLLDLKNSWQEEGENELTPDEFKSYMTIDQISVYPDGAFEFVYEGNDFLFGSGYSIYVRGNLLTGPTGAGFPV